MDTNKASGASIQSASPFLAWLQEWQSSLPSLSAGDVFSQAERAAIISIDLTNGFCKSGPLASPRVNAVVAPSVRLFQTAWELGMRNFLLSQDTHEPDALEFSAWPAHAVRGSAESTSVPEIRALPFYDRMTIIEKNSISSTAGTALNAWLEQHSEVDTFIIVGDCTDLCVYDLAMDLHTAANARHASHRVIVPASCVDTYDLPVESARSIGALPHPAGLIHPLFLYQMALNGIEVVKEIC